MKINMNIKNKNLILFLQTILNKPISEITNNDLSMINTIALEGEIRGDSIPIVDFRDLDLFSNINKIIVSNSYISLNDLNKIKEYNNINQICFKKCMFENGNLDFPNNILKLELLGCFIGDYKFLKSMTNLQKLVINNPYTNNSIDLSYISNMKCLKELILDKCILSNFDSLLNLNYLEILSLLWTSLPNNYINILNQLPALKKLYISEEYNSNLINNSIEIKNNLNEFIYEPYTK